VELRRDKKFMGKKFLGTLALGALIGSAIGLFFSPDTGKKNRARFSKVAKQVSENLIKEVAKVSHITKKEYNIIVDRVINKNLKEKILDPESWQEIKNELKLRWEDIQAEAKKYEAKQKKLKK